MICYASDVNHTSILTKQTNFNPTSPPKRSGHNIKMKVATLLSIVLMAVGATANALPKGLIARDCEEDDSANADNSATPKQAKEPGLVTKTPGNAIVRHWTGQQVVVLTILHSYAWRCF
ncbi:uncharacterized protein RCO7_10611 [Rhynchosporium graminicola]|uniref:Uncharacterized protein n=1 Tax=Rhynchosporium graminicola TaxID=2792576 RepID=A0A1E1LBM1_9HELO|nr:uncharacterized protein RCO7_10611 [Rhynchosporium commune]